MTLPLPKIAPGVPFLPSGAKVCIYLHANGYMFTSCINSACEPVCRLERHGPERVFIPLRAQSFAQGWRLVVSEVELLCLLNELLIPRSMLPDAVDDFRLKNPNCLNLEAFFYSFYVFFNKFAGGLALGISTMSLQ